uniref:DREV methyltransferase n=1 Tax=Acrobeloides nanus TaxID=290746 RepID=A0A914D2D8_9BILA
MQWRLKQHGFKILDIEKWKETGPYELISVLNLLDRHYNPQKLLKELFELSSRSNCMVLLAIVLPVSQYVEFNLKNTSNTYPDNWLPISGTTFEEQVNSIIHDVFEPSNFEIVRWTKLPYLCEGDSVRAYYKLDDAIFLLKPRKTSDQVQYSENLESQHVHHEHDTL